MSDSGGWTSVMKLLDSAKVPDSTPQNVGGKRIDEVDSLELDGPSFMSYFRRLRLGEARIACGVARKSPERGSTSASDVKVSNSEDVQGGFSAAFE